MKGEGGSEENGGKQIILVLKVSESDTERLVKVIFLSCQRHITFTSPHPIPLLSSRAVSLLRHRKLYCSQLNVNQEQ